MWLDAPPAVLPSSPAKLLGNFIYTASVIYTEFIDSKLSVVD